MKKQITLALGALLFTACLRADETVSTPVVPVENVEVTVSEVPVAPALTESVTVESAKSDEQPANGVSVVKKSYVPTLAQAKAWCVDHKLVVGGAAATLGFIVLWKTCPAIRAFFGCEDEQDQEKFVY